MQHLSTWRRWAVLATSCALAACGSEDDSGQSPESPASNNPPTISGTPVATAKVGQEYLFEPAAYDPDGDTLTFAILNRPDWATFSPTTGRFRGTPPAGARPEYPDIQISVTDGKQTSSLPAFKLTVEATQLPNTAPVISGTPATTVVAGTAYSFTPVATDADGQTLTFSIANQPSWAQFDTATGRLTGTPAAGQVGTYAAITISVSDGSAQASLPAFSIVVSSGTTPNQSPVISGTPPQAVTAGQTYRFQPVATDPDGQSLTFAIVNLPAWATFSTATGELRGTPGSANVGQTSNIVISVSDGQATASLPAFAITVLAANSAPTIAGVPPTSVTAGQAYSFTPTASDPDAGQTLRFGIANQPAWASFDIVTGRLSGTPTSSDVGSYGNIVISVSDGIASATLPAFTITVADVQTGSATLNWTPPTLNEDGTPLTDLKGYRIFYGTSSASLNLRLDIPNPGVTSAVIENLSPGTWYFGMKTYNTSNVESGMSSVVSKTIQ